MLSYPLFINYLGDTEMQESCREIRTVEVLENFDDDFGQQIVDNIVFPPEQADYNFHMLLLFALIEKCEGIPQLS